MKAFRECRYGYISLAIGIVEVLVIWGGFALFRETAIRAPSWTQELFRFVYFGGLMGIGLALVGLARDSWRLLAGLALLFSVLNAVMCSVTILV
jgi:hypothetical protein